MSHARVEELSDSDPEIDDPSNYLPETDDSVIQFAQDPSQQTSSSSSHSIPPYSSSRSPNPNPNPTLFRPPPADQIPQLSQQQQQQMQSQSREAFKHWQTLYPIYFDSTRTRAQGRRVSKNLAVPNPLAWSIMVAIRSLEDDDVLGGSSSSTIGGMPLNAILEPDKTHPKDWANPGRVRVMLKDHDTRTPHNSAIKCKARLYTLIARHLKANPTQRDTPLSLKLPGLPIPEKFAETDVVVPRGWKMGTILPVHSAAVSGGGVRDDFFKEAMEEMRQAQSSGQMPPGAGMPDMSALQNMMSSMGGMGGMGGLGGLLGGGGGGGEPSGGGGNGGKKKKDKKK